MKLEYSITQPFGANFNQSYQSMGLKGHNGVDYDGGHGAPVHSIFDQEHVYKVLSVDKPANDGSGFTGVFTIVDNGIEVFEVLYGHGNPEVNVGQLIHKGDVVINQSNHGLVFSNGVQITLEMQKAGDKRGSHVHLQKRILRKDLVKFGNNKYLTDQSGETLHLNGYYYAIPFYSNGYNGCVDPVAPVFNRDLFLGCRGYDVGCLQRFLIARNFMHGEATEFFGLLTKKAVSAFQKANNISPVGGYCGKTTRGIINSILK